MTEEREAKTAFISGPIEQPEDYFDLHYKPQIDEAINLGHSFVVGPSPGTDSMALRYLIDKGVKSTSITLYMAEFQQVILGDRVDWFVELGGNVQVEGVTTGARDACMTRDSDYDILRYMSIEEQKVFYGDRYYQRVSATERNERRRKGLPLYVNQGPLTEPEREVSGKAAETKLVGTSPRASNWKTRMKNVFK